MDYMIILSIITTILSALISAVISYIIATKNNTRNEEARLNEQILALNKITIEYPFLEDDDFCKSWSDNRNSKDEKYLRYDAYCCIVFNLLEQIFKLYKGDDEKINNFFHIKEMVQRHQLWWNAPTGIIINLDGYTYEFREYIKKYLL